MPKQSFTVNDFSGGTNGFVDPQNILDNELAQCQGFKADPGVVSVLGDMKGAYVPAAASENINLEAGYGFFAFTHDYTDAGALAATNYIVLMDSVYFEVYSDELVDSGTDDDWVQNAFGLGAAASGSSFAGSVKPCFFIVDGAIRVSPGNFTAKDSDGDLEASADGNFAATTTYGAYEAVVADSDITDDISAGDTIVLSGQEMIAIIVSSTALTAARNMTGLFPSAISATTDDAINVVLDTRWRGVVSRKSFQGLTTIGTFTEWYSTYSHPRPPITWHADLDHDNITDHSLFPFLVNCSALAIGNSGGDAPAVQVGYYASTDNDKSTWDGAIISLYVTALYDEAKQESQPHKAATFTVAQGKELAVAIGVLYNDDASSATYRINKRVTGARLYYEDTTNDPGALFQLLEIDLEKGCKKADAEEFTAWVVNSSAVGVACPYQSLTTASDRTVNQAFIFTNPPKSFTYEINTGYTPDVNIHARYKTAVVANRRLFAGNIYQGGKAYGDRMIGSPPNKFDILPETNFIDVAVGDGDEIVKLEAYADRLLQFKKRTLYIINIGGAPGEEFLESQHKSMGVENPSQTCLTEYGVAWVNAQGVFLFDGQAITDLTRGKLQLTSSTRPLALNVTESNVPIIGYHPSNKWLVVHPQAKVTDGDDVEAWIHDFKNGSWTYSQEFTATDDLKTNMVITPDNELVFAAGTNSSNTPDFFKYRTPAANMSQGKLLLLTKEFNLNAPGVKKKLRSVYVTYSASADSYVEADVLYKHPTGATTTEEDLAEAGTDGSSGTYYTNALGFKSTSGNVRTVELAPKTYITNAYSFQLKLHNPDAAYPHGADFKLYNIQFVYRPLGVR